jgi:hypothetical protein
MSMSRAGEAAVRRARLLQGASGLVEDLQVSGLPAARPHTDDYSPDFQVCLPLSRRVRLARRPG